MAKTVGQLRIRRVITNPDAKERNMSLSWIKTAKQFKSPLPVVAGFLLRSRETKNAKCQQLRQQRDQLQRQLEDANHTLTQQQQGIERLKQQVQKLETQKRQMESQPITLPDAPPFGKSGFGSRIVTLAVNLDRSVGLRGAARVIATFGEWLGRRSESTTLDDDSHLVDATGHCFDP